MSGLKIPTLRYKRYKPGSGRPTGTRGWRPSWRRRTPPSAEASRHGRAHADVLIVNVYARPPWPLRTGPPGRAGGVGPTSPPFVGGRGSRAARRRRLGHRHRLQQPPPGPRPHRPAPSSGRLLLEGPPFAARRFAASNAAATAMPVVRVPRDDSASDGCRRSHPNGV